MAITLVPLATGLGGGRDPKSDQAARTAALAAMLGEKSPGSGSALPYSKGAMLAQALKGGIDGLGQNLAARADQDQRTAYATSVADLLLRPAGATPLAAAAPAAMGAPPAAPSAVSAAPSGPLNPTSKVIYDGLIQRGVPSMVAAGMVGNIAAESNFNPTIADNRGEGSVGLIQARGPRLTALQQMAAAQGKPMGDVGVQLDHIVSEFNGPESKAYAIAQQAQTPAEAALALAKHYERPAAWALAQSGPKRASVAEQVFRDYGSPQTAQADMPAPGAKPIGFDPMGNFSPDSTDGFVVPPAPEPAPTLPVGNVSVPMPPDAAPAIAQSLAGLEPNAPVALPEAMAPVADAAPMPPPRPMDLGAPPMPAPPVPPPLPPARPQFADMPAPGATETAAQMPPQGGPGLARLPGPPLMVANPLPDWSNANDAGAGAFARSGMGSPSSMAQMLGSAVSGQATPAAPNPVQLAQAQALAGPQPTASDAAPMNIAPQTQGGAPDPRRAALVALLSNPNTPSGVASALVAQLMPQKPEAYTLGENQYRYVGGQLVAKGPERPKDDRTSDIKEYEYAQRQGFAGSYTDYETAKKKAGATNVVVDAGNKELQVTEARKQIAASLGYQPNTPEYNRVVLEGKAPEAAKPGNVPAEMGARIGLGNLFIDKHLPAIRADLDSGVLDGPRASIEMKTGTGRAGEIVRQVQEGSEALVRNLTGAGQTESEARAYAQRYQPTWYDSKDKIKSKLEGLEDALKATREGALAGKGATDPALVGKAPAANDGWTVVDGVKIRQRR